jgi:hypothetical protein
MEPARVFLQKVSLQYPSSLTSKPLTSIGTFFETVQRASDG